MKLLLTGGCILLVALAIAILNYPVDTQEPYSENLSYTGLVVDEKSDLRYWSHMPLTYNYSNEDECYPLRINRTEWALNEIEKLTESQVSFVHTEGKADISFVCSKNSLVNLADRTETLGEAEVEYSLRSPRIMSAKIYLYSGIPQGCDYPDVEIHEILHAFGEKHNTHPQSVMNVVQWRCLKGINTSVDGVIFDRLKYTY